MKRKRQTDDSKLPKGWTMNQQPSGGKTYTHKKFGKVRSLTAIFNLSKKTKKSIKSTKPKKKSTLNKAIIT